MRARRSGFTLVELSIVLVIVGLLVGAILGGQSLIQAHKVRNVLTDAKTYAMAMQQFKDKFGYLPGDFPTATSVWGSDAAACTSASDLVPGTCNGNGDGFIGEASVASGTAEDFQLWKQMRLANFISGNFSGLNGPDGANYDAVPGVNSPIGSLDKSTFWIYGYWGVQTTDNVSFFIGDYTNAMVFAGRRVGSWPDAAVLFGKEAAMIDEKGDDGKPAYGNIRTFTYLDCVSTQVGSTAVYNKNSGSSNCRLLFLNNFMSPKQ